MKITTPKKLHQTIEVNPLPDPVVSDEFKALIETAKAEARLGTVVNNSHPDITVKELYDQNIHGITFSLLDRALGAKVYKSNQGAELRLNFNGEVRLVHLINLDQVKQFRDNVDFLYQVVKQKANQQ